MQGVLHPSLRAYIDCFLSPPFPKGFPRGGGIWDQDPILVRDFRFIREFEVQWKQTQEKLEHLKRSHNDVRETEEGGYGQDDALSKFIEDLGEEDVF